MNLSDRIREEFSTWIASVADACVAAMSRFSAKRQVLLTETAPNTFKMSAQPTPKEPGPPDCQFVLVADEPSPPLAPDWKAALRGSRIEVRLAPSRFLFRPLDLPKRAADFLDAMVRSQIDRLTPWTANEAVFNWSAPVETAGDRISMTVVATPKTKIAPFVRVAEESEAESVIVFAATDDTLAVASGGTKVFEKRLRGSLDVTRMRRILGFALLGAAAAAALSLIVTDIIDGQLESEQQQLSRKISERRAAMRINLAMSGDSAQNLLARRKQNTPSSIMVLEALSTILPDNTYVTELRIEKDKLQIVGLTQDAPSLVKLIEQSPHFTHATFFAPTTRSSNDPGERFHVEAQIKPHFGTDS
jgi:general secretion pathway protein L